MWLNRENPFTFLWMQAIQCSWIEWLLLWMQFEFILLFISLTHFSLLLLNNLQFWIAIYLFRRLWINPLQEILVISFQFGRIIISSCLQIFSYWYHPPTWGCYYFRHLLKQQLPNPQVWIITYNRSEQYFFFFFISLWKLFLSECFILNILNNWIFNIYSRVIRNKSNCEWYLIRIIYHLWF